jgi:transcriptional regulator with XRE-family HTH domain/Zn-dependent peptidase ImmA (M78 family)
MEKFIGAKLKRAREALGFSQAAFGRAVGLSSEYISLLEYGKRTPSFATLQKLVTFLNRDIAYFFSEKPAPPDSFTLLFRAEAVDERAREDLQKFRRYCDEYLKLEAVTGRRLGLSPLYPPNIRPERLAEEERCRLGLGTEPVRDVFALFEANGCRILRLPMSEDSRVSGVFIYLEAKEAAFALVNSAQSAGRQALSAAHEYCHYLRDRNEGPVIDNPDVFIDEYVSLYHPREVYAQTFAARFLMPLSKIREIVEKDLGSERVNYDGALYLKRYFGVSTLAMLRALRGVGFLSKREFDEWSKLDPALREKELFGSVSGGQGNGWAAERGAGGAGRPGRRTGSTSGLVTRIRRRAIPSDRFKLLQREAARKITREKTPARAIQKKLPTAEDLTRRDS